MALTNKEARKAYGHEYYVKNKDKFLEDCSKRYRKNHAVNLKRMAQYREDPEFRERAKKNAKAWHKKNRKRVLEYWFLRKYGLTLEQYEARCREQGDACAICRRHRNDLKARLVVDHCHETGLVRGLLCDECNLALGWLRDDPTRAQATYRYLAKFEDAMAESA